MDEFRDFDGSIDPFFYFFFAIAGLIALVFLAFVVAIGKATVQGMQQRSRDNAAPVLTVPGAVVAKRQDHHRTSDHSHTSYFVTFEIQGHDRIEFPVEGNQWGTLLEGDRGQVTYQGTRFKGFNRTPQDR
ncbi:DUF2500 domain-containing protein [Kineosporia sp. NBRC 101731]|uniref:DUF2500 domain-containing protein n=1 Tax=Kineosporia sp. NBRC 101731 TaxID=3032199 RepID=UPI0024A0C61F|nr:DUF2500 domain-containing protein [Kineosporia sp. NBRC 101731]GLY33355.1 hypothetical protein Kisp02_67200 [Kineosporia sp. NBRC 101731]